MLNRIAVLLLVFLAPILSPAGAHSQAELEGFVVNVTRDGLLIVSINQVAEIVRLAGIDYPQEDEPDPENMINFSRSSVMNKTVRIQRIGTDSRGNILGRVYIENRCLNDDLIHAGLVQPVRQQETK
jgi:endonuclease YncB( thermonuclease family)